MTLWQRKTFLFINFFWHLVFQILWKNYNLPKRSHPALFHQPHSKNWDPVKHPLLENLVDSFPTPKCARTYTTTTHTHTHTEKKKRGGGWGAHYGILERLCSWILKALEQKQLILSYTKKIWNSFSSNISCLLSSYMKNQSTD